MNPGFQAWLGDRLEEIEVQGLWRETTPIARREGKRVVLADGRDVVDFASNDYLGLATHPVLKRGAAQAVQGFGAGSGAARLLSGTPELFSALEEAIARWKGTEASLCFSSGYAASTGALKALFGPGDWVVFDKLCHACLVDGVRDSGASFRVFPHNRLEGLVERLSWASEQVQSGGRLWVVTESVFSMDGDQASLADIAEIAQRFDACLFVDEAHACGLWGERGSGLVEAQGLTEVVDVQLGTLGKAVGAAGGFISGSASLIAYLRHRARSFLFSTAPVPAVAGAALEGIRWIQSSAGASARDRLREWRGLFEERSGFGSASPIVPIPIGDERDAVARARDLMARGFWAPAVRFPTVARGRARLRVSLAADHSRQDLEGLAQALLNS